MYTEHNPSSQKVTCGSLPASAQLDLAEPSPKKDTCVSDIVEERLARYQMNRRSFTLSFLLVTAIVFASLASRGDAQTAETQSWTPPRTSWGDPGLQGVWNNNTVVVLPQGSWTVV